MQTPLHQADRSAQQHETHGDGRNQLAGGLILVGAGVLLLLGQFFNLGVWILITLGFGLTAAGIATQHPGWFIPGGVLNGIGLGALLIDRQVVSGETAEGGVFLLAFALGWASISVFTRLFTAKPLLWPLIPAAVMLAVGIPLLLGEIGLTLLSLLNYAWPLALIVGGLYLLLRWQQR
jgi:hypothetical protein